MAERKISLMDLASQTVYVVWITLSLVMIFVPSARMTVHPVARGMVLIAFCVHFRRIWKAGALSATPRQIYEQSSLRKPLVRHSLMVFLCLVISKIASVVSNVE